MARDYKHRAQRPRRNSKRQPAVAWWKWLLIVLLIGLFAWFLSFLGGSEPQGTVTELPVRPQQKPARKNSPAGQAVEKAVQPRFDFYTILPEKEVLVPDYEIKTRKRAERVGKAKDTLYVLQAGSFRNYKDADSLKARLALMGIESNIEVAEVGSTRWNRIKIGPFRKMSTVDRIRKRLRQNNIDVVVMEAAK